jgi:hypothetical protein
MLCLLWIRAEWEVLAGELLDDALAEGGQIVW